VALSSGRIKPIRVCIAENETRKNEEKGNSDPAIRQKPAHELNSRTPHRKTRTEVKHYHLHSGKKTDTRQGAQGLMAWRGGRIFHDSIRMHTT